MARPSKRVRARQAQRRLAEIAMMVTGAGITGLMGFYWLYVYRLWQHGQVAETRLFGGLMLVLYGLNIAEGLWEEHKESRRQWVFPARIIE